MYKRQAYYNFRANEAYQQEYFRRGLSQPKKSRANIMARVLEQNPKFIRESIYAEQLDGQARKILRGYAVGLSLIHISPVCRGRSADPPTLLS